MGDSVLVTEPSLTVPTGGGAQMSFPNGAGEMLWRLVHNPQPRRVDVMCAVSCIESYEYLVLACTQKEAARRISIIRKAWKAAKAAVNAGERAP